MNLRQLKAADVFIYTLGVAPCFFDRETGAFILPRPSQLNMRALAERFVYRTTTVEENADNMAFILETIRTINPRLKSFLTVSPVPLHATFERKAAVLADCLSKSILRVAAETVLTRGFPDTFYWPSFEIVRWLGGHVGPVFGVDDGSSFHVSEHLVEQIVELFIQTFSCNGEKSQAFV